VTRVLLAPTMPNAPCLPPALRRQKASKLNWPLDSDQSWTYYNYTPGEVAAACKRELAAEIDARDVAVFFSDGANLTADKPAYIEYAQKYASDIEILCPVKKRRVM